MIFKTTKNKIKKWKTDRNFNKLFKAIDNKDFSISLEAVYALLSFNDFDVTEKTLQKIHLKNNIAYSIPIFKLLYNESSVWRFEAAKILKSMNWNPSTNDELVLYLIAFIPFTHGEKRKEITKSIEKVGYPACKILTSFLSYNKESQFTPEIIPEIIELTGKLGKEKELDSLNNIFQIQSEALGGKALYPYHEKVIEAIGNIGGDKSVRILKEYIKKFNSKELVGIAIRNLPISNASAESVMIELLDDSRPTLVETVLFHIHLFPTEKVKKELVKKVDKLHSYREYGDACSKIGQSIVDKLIGAYRNEKDEQTKKNIKYVLNRLMLDKRLEIKI